MRSAKEITESLEIAKGLCEGKTKNQQSYGRTDCTFQEKRDRGVV